MSTLAQAAAGTMLMTIRHGREEMIGRLKVACARALSLINQIATVRADRAVTDSASNRAGRRQRVGALGRDTAGAGRCVLIEDQQRGSQRRFAARACADRRTIRAQFSDVGV